jgi:hypothetical protein
VSGDQLDKTDPPRLSQLLSLDESSSRTWEPDELSAILRHQLSAQLEFDLGDISAELTELGVLGHAGTLRWSVTFGDLLQSARPSLPLLDRAKRFAKACKSDPGAALPEEVATVMYFACIIVARMRCGARISALDDEALREGLRWAVSQRWVDDETGRLLREGVAHLESGT